MLLSEVVIVLLRNSIQITIVGENPVGRNAIKHRDGISAFFHAIYSQPATGFHRLGWLVDGNACVYVLGGGEGKREREDVFVENGEW